MARDTPTETHGLDRFLRLFADVRPGEGTTALLLALNIFLLLTAYYVLKPVREALILGQGSAELKSYMSAGMGMSRPLLKFDGGSGEILRDVRL